MWYISDVLPFSNQHSTSAISYNLGILVLSQKTNLFSKLVFCVHPQKLSKLVDRYKDLPTLVILDFEGTRDSYNQICTCADPVTLTPYWQEMTACKIDIIFNVAIIVEDNVV